MLADDPTGQSTRQRRATSRERFCIAKPPALRHDKFGTGSASTRYPQFGFLKGITEYYGVTIQHFAEKNAVLPRAICHCQRLLCVRGCRERARARHNFLKSVVRIVMIHVMRRNELMLDKDGGRDLPLIQNIQA